MATLVAAAFSVLGPASYFTARTWIEDQQRATITKNTAKHSAEQVQQDLANVANNVSKALPVQLIFGVIGAALLVFIALKVREGKYWTRWGLVGVWVLVTLTGYSSIGLGGLIVVGSSAPTQVKVASFLGAAAFLVALVAVNLPSSVLYLNANRPERSGSTPGGAGGLGGLGTLFRPRPASSPAPQPTQPAPSRARAPKPAPPVQRTKAKTRPASTEANGQPPPASPAPKSGGGTGRSRGKSRGR
jgi:hypothetical protein